MVVFKHYANRNSLTRDELANERSFLAYIRCATTMLVSIIALQQASLHFLIKNHTHLATAFHNDQKPVTIVMGIVATLLVLAAAYRMRLNGLLLAENAILKPTIWGAITLVLILLSLNIALLKYCITFGISGYIHL